MTDEKQQIRQIETSSATIEFRGDGLLKVSIKPGSNVNLEEARENHEATEKVAGDSELLVLVDARPAISMSREARMFFADPQVRKNTIAQAILIDSGISKVIGNFFIGLNKPKFPVKLFTSESEAIEWLKGYAR